jgi:hypothetical protein
MPEIISYQLIDFVHSNVIVRVITELSISVPVFATIVLVRLLKTTGFSTEHRRKAWQQDKDKSGLVFTLFSKLILLEFIVVVTYLKTYIVRSWQEHALW